MDSTPVLFEFEFDYDLSYCFVKVNEYMDKIMYSTTPDERTSAIIGMYQFLLNPKARNLFDDARTINAFSNKANDFLEKRIDGVSPRLDDILEKTLKRFLSTATTSPPN